MNKKGFVVFGFFVLFGVGVVVSDDDPPTEPPAGDAAPPAVATPAPGGDAAPAAGDAPPAPAGDDAPAAGGDAPAEGSVIPIDPLEDEDALLSQTEIGDPLIRTQLTLYFERITAILLGLAPADNSRSDKINRRYPVFKLLDLSRIVMQKTCPALIDNLLKMATQTFTSLQLETLHVREPYLGYSAYQRIRLGLERCIADAKPHTFVFDKPGGAAGSTTEAAGASTTEAAPADGSSTPGGESTTEASGPQTTEGPDPELDLICRPNPLKLTSTTTLSMNGDGVMRNNTIPDYASGIISEGKINEPIIELVWKILLNAHSYCYTRFSDYYNDHHTFTVTMVPLFTNQIQDIWLKEYDLSDTNKTVIYGGLLGDPIAMLTKANDCVSASREQGAAYPWLINRPPRDKTFDWARGVYKK